MPDGNGKIGKNRFLNETMEDSKFQVTIQMELGKLWRQVDENEEDIKKLNSGWVEESKKISELKVTIDYLQNALKNAKEELKAFHKDIKDCGKNCSLEKVSTDCTDSAKKIEVLQTKIDLLYKVGYGLITGFVGLLIKVIWELVKGS